MEACNCNKVNAAVITPVLAAGSTAPPYLFDVNITQRLCYATCVSQTPVFNPTFNLVGYSSLGNNMYMATVAVSGLISYVPCNGNTCCTKTQLLSQTFTLPFYSVNAPSSVTIASGQTTNAMAAAPCRNCSRSFVSETPVTLTVA